LLQELKQETPCDVLHVQNHLNGLSILLSGLNTHSKNKLVFVVNSHPISNENFLINKEMGKLFEGSEGSNISLNGKISLVVKAIR
jgi:hypothetical protein